MTKKEIKIILKKHKLWLEEKGGERADFSGQDLRGADFSGQDLRCVDFSGANCEEAKFKKTNCIRADFTEANCAGADFVESNCECANFTKAYLDNIIYDDSSFFALQCPEEGTFIGYKKCRNDLIVKLEILEDAKRSSATTRKCRCSAAKVLSITHLGGSNAGNVAYSFYDESFEYRVGEIVSVDDFDEDRWNECSTGIHFFMTRDEAVEYRY